MESESESGERVCVCGERERVSGGGEWVESESEWREASERSQRVSGAREGVERVCVERKSEWRERYREGLTRVPMPPTPDSRAARCKEKVLPTPNKAQSTDA